MMDKNFTKVILFNTWTVGDIAIDSATGNIKIPKFGYINTSERVVINPTGPYYVDKTVSAAEVRKVQTITLVSNGGAVVAEQKYGFELFSIKQKYQSVTQSPIPFKTTAPSTLTGSAPLDRHAIYQALANQVNDNAASNADAYPLIQKPHNAEAPGPFTVGSTITGVTSGATGILISDAGNTATLAVIQGTFTDAESLTDGTNTGTANGAVVYGVGLRVVDKAGYFYPATPRGGENTIVITDGFVASTDYAVTTAAVYAFGDGTRLGLMQPRPDRISGNFSQGSLDGPIEDTPVNGATYTAYDIPFRKLVQAQNPGGVQGQQEGLLRIYVNEGNAGAYVTAIQTDLTNVGLAYV